MTRWLVKLTADAADDEGASEASASEFVLDESLGYLVNRAARMMAHDLAEELRPAAVAIGQWAVLIVLWARDGISQAELSRRVAIEPPTMVRTLDRMVRDGLVTRTPDSSDARIVRIHLTDRGRALRDELVPRAVEVNTRTLARLRPAEAKVLMRLLHRLLASGAHTQPDSG